MRNISQRAAVGGLVVGILAIPALVLASTAILDDRDRIDDGVRSDESARVAGAIVDATTITAPPVTSPPIADTDDADTDDADIVTACGPDGAELVAREASGEITELEQAALDALRPICLEAGLPLADAPMPEPIVIVETVIEAAPATANPAGNDAAAHDDEDHDDEDDDDEEHDEEEHDEDDG